MKKLTSWFAGGRRKSPTKPQLPFDVLTPGFVQDPGPHYAWLRAHAPLAPLVSGGFLLTRHDDIGAAFTNPALGNAPSRFSALAEKNRNRHVAADVASNIPPFLDKPAHVPARQAVSHAFFRTFDGAAPWIGNLAQAHAARGAAKQGTVDVVADIARPYVMSVMARFVGLPDAGAELAECSAALFRLFAPVQDRAEFEATNTALSAARAFIARAAAAPPERAEGSFLAHLQGWEGPNGALSPEQITDNALLVLADGIENVEAAIAQVLLQLHRVPNICAQLDPGSDTLEHAVSEALRLSTPGQIIPRVAAQDTRLCDTDLNAGTPVFLALGSANLDPDAFADPETFKLHRDTQGAYLFGQGRHRCIGAPLALQVVTHMIGALLQQGAVVACDPGDVAYQPRFGHRWPAAVPVRFSRG